jgi:4-hydroxybutyrate CoA-transferase
LIEDGATLQMGIGAIPNAVLAALIDHRDLGIHTEMFSDGAIDLIERGVVNNEKQAHAPRQGGRCVRHGHATAL